MSDTNETGVGSVNLAPFFITTTGEYFTWVTDYSWEIKEEYIKIEIK